MFGESREPEVLQIDFAISQLVDQYLLISFE